MKWYSSFTHPDDWFFIIEDGGQAGFYLYVYEGREGFDEDVEDPDYCSRHQQDHLQDTLIYAMEQAFEDFGVPMDTWVEVV